MDGEVRTTSSINLLAGIWLVAAPFALAYSSNINVWQEVIFGAAAAVFGAFRLVAPSVTWPGWANVLIGLWFVIVPWALVGTTTAARWNEVIVGLIVAFLSYSSIAATLEHRTE